MILPLEFVSVIQVFQEKHVTRLPVLWIVVEKESVAMEFAIVLKDFTGLDANSNSAKQIAQAEECVRMDSVIAITVN